MWVRILKDKDYFPKPRRMMSFKEGVEQQVLKSIGDAGVAEGWAEEIEAPNAEQAKEAKVTGKVPEPKAK